MDRLGRNVVDCLNTGYKMRDEKKVLVTYEHDGLRDLDDSADENRFTMEAWGAQMELRAIQRGNRDATIKIRAAGRPKGKPSYGYRYVRKVMGGKVDHVELHPRASEVIRDVARRILADPENELFPTCRCGGVVGGLYELMKLLVDGFTTKITRADQELCVLVYPSVIDPSSTHLRYLAQRLAARRREIGTRWRRLTPGRQALLVLAHLRCGGTYAHRHWPRSGEIAGALERIALLRNPG